MFAEEVGGFFLVNVLEPQYAVVLMPPPTSLRIHIRTVRQLAVQRFHFDLQAAAIMQRGHVRLLALTHSTSAPVCDKQFSDFLMTKQAAA